MLNFIWIIVLCLSVLPARADDLSLTQALDLARQQTIKLQKLSAELDLAKADYQRSARAFLPVITADSTWFRIDSGLINDLAPPLPALTRGRSTLASESGDLRISGIQLIQPIFNADAWKAREQAKLTVGARHKASLWGRRVIRFQTARRYYAVAVQEAEEQAAVLAIEAARQALELAEAAYREGLVSKLDVVRADAEFMAGRARLKNARAGVRKGEIELAILLGLPPEKQMRLTSELPIPDPPVTDRADAVKRADLEAMKTMQKAASVGLEKARTGYLPKVNLLARQQWVDGDEPFEVYGDGWLVAVNLQWTLFDGFGRTGQIAKALARKRLAQIKTEKARREAISGQQLAAIDWRAAWSAWQASVHALKAAFEAASLARQRYQQGLGNMTDFLATQAALYQRRLEYSRYQYRALVASMNYHLQTGLAPLDPLPKGS